jgi:hypothetical protein
MVNDKGLPGDYSPAIFGRNSCDIWSTDMATIKTLPFGDKSAIARTLTTKGNELKASILESAVLPILSNALAGHSTFAPLIGGKGHNAKCPLQAALWALMFTDKGKARTTATSRAIGAVFTLASVKSADQAAHDETLSDAIILIADALTPIKSDAPAKPAKVDYEALYTALQIDHAELVARHAELVAKHADAVRRTVALSQVSDLAESLQIV